MVTDKTLLKEVTKELWQSVKKLRPELGKEPRMQLVLKALITIGDLPNAIEAAMVVGVCLELEEDADESPKVDGGKATATESSQIKEMPDGRRVVRRRSASE